VSLRAIKAALRFEGVSSAQKLVLIALADRVGDQLECFPSVATIAEELGESPRWVQRQLQGLTEAGAVDRIPTVVESGRQTSNTYRLRLWPVAAECRKPVARGEGVNSDALITLNPKKEPKEGKESPHTPQGDGVGVVADSDDLATAADAAAYSRGGLCQIVGTQVVGYAPAFLALKEAWREYAPAMRWRSDLLAAKAYNAAVMGGADGWRIANGVQWSVAIATPELARHVPAAENWIAGAMWQQQVPEADRGEWSGDGSEVAS